ncbi:MAG: hypothetical protein WC668_03460 [Patescibacteria group bacterium]|jgi:hypothetical protein
MAYAKFRSMDDMPEAGLPSEMPMAGRRKRGVWKSIISILIVLIIAVLAVGAVMRWGGSLLGGDPIAHVSSADWQAVFLGNGQVYFGKVTAVGRKTLTLTDIYYLQVVTKPLQQTQQSATAASDQSQQELTLIKLGNEIHGPSDRMVINRDMILLTEKLKKDSRVVQAISKYISDQKTATK